MLKDMKVGTKLIGGFLLVAALTAFIGAFAILKMKTIGNQYQRHWQDNSRALQDIGNATAAYQRLRVNIRDYVIAANGDQERAALDKVNSRIEEFQKGFDDFRSLPLTDEVKELAQQAKSSW